jgi:hypothetical protein
MRQGIPKPHFFPLVTAIRRQAPWWLALRRRRRQHQLLRPQRSQRQPLHLAIPPVFAFKQGIKKPPEGGFF